MPRDKRDSKPTTVDRSEGFDQLLSFVDHAMLVVTTVAGDVHAGCLVGFHTQCSIDPPRYAIWLSKANFTFQIAVLADVFALHFLDVGNGDLAALFGTVSGDDNDKFAHCGWRTGPEQVRLLDDCADRIVARRVAMHDDGSDHVCFVLEPIETHAPTAFVPLPASRVRDLDAGHAPDERPTPRRA
jgi:flavin reductase (DIM6/NTAB) family NADH-FMN oxidoreductase RutF